MNLSFIVACYFLALYDGSCSHIVPNAIGHMLTNVNNGNNGAKQKRQTSSQLQCVSDKLDDAFQGNETSFVSGCKSMAIRIIELDLSNPQPQITSFYRFYCIPECGDAINDAYNECGVYRVSLPGTERLNIDLCGTNQQGDTCYELYGDGLQLVNSERSCYETYISSNMCRCRSTLVNGVAEQGCCIDAYHDFVSGLSGGYQPSTLYSSCNVNPPGGCNNSPITASSSATICFTTNSLLLLVVTLFFYNIL